MARNHTLENTRNFGIMAHIDAGKTRTPTAMTTAKTKHRVFLRVFM